MASSYSYNIEFVEDTLHVGFNPDIKATGDRIVQDAKIQLDQLITSQQLPQGGLLKINGPASVPVSYLIAHELGHLFATIAVFDPKIGGERQNRYVVVINYAPQYKVGDILEFNGTQITKISSNIANNNDRSSFLLDLQDNILKVGFNPSVTASNAQIAVDATARIEELITNQELPGDYILKINGRTSVIASYVIAHKLASFTSAIAVFDPKIGDRGLDRYIITIEHGSGYSIGDTLEYVVPQRQTAKIVICGSPNTGKTCLREGLKQAIRKIPNIPDSYFLFISGCPDGDGAWFLETAQQYPDVARELKDKYQASFTAEFARGKAAEINAIQNSLLVFDVGGKITPENWIIMSKATHAVILAKNDEELAEWQKFCHKLDLPIVAIIHSDLEAKSDVIQYEGDRLKGIIHCLLRGEDISSRPMVKELAKLSIDLVNGN